MSMTTEQNRQDTPVGAHFVDNALANTNNPVVLFSLSWCSFCHALKQLLNTLSIDFQAYELDRGEFLEPTLNKELRMRLRQLSNSSTLPLLFIGDECIGGYTETVAALRTGQLQKTLENQGIAYAKPEGAK